ncbi:MAG: hypothetical protein ACHQ1D_01110 [Nitrososphaerales archaeon]
MNHQIIKNETTGKEIHLSETKDIAKLKNQLMLLGMNGLFYSPWAKDIQLKIKRLEEKK